MGNNKRNVPYKKNKQMLDKYKNSLKKRTPRYDDTAYVENLINLESSDEVGENINENIPKSKTPLKYMIAMWWKNCNKVEVVINLIFAPIIVAFLGWIYSTNMELIEINMKIDNIQNSIQTLEINYATKTELNLQIDNIKENMKSSKWNNDYDEINIKLDKIKDILNERE